MDAISTCINPSFIKLPEVLYQKKKKTSEGWYSSREFDIFNLGTEAHIFKYHILL